MLPQIVVRQLLDIPQLHYLSHPGLSKSYNSYQPPPPPRGYQEEELMWLSYYQVILLPDSSGEEYLPDDVDLTTGVHHIELHTAPGGAGVDEHHGVGDPPVTVSVLKGIHLQRHQ